MNIIKTLIESVKVYKNIKLFWLLGLGMALLSFDFYSTRLVGSEGLRCLFAPVQLTFFILSSLIGASLIILTFNYVQNKSVPYTEVWKEAKSKFFFRLIGAGLLYSIVILVFIFLYFVLSRYIGSSLLFGLFAIVFSAVGTSQVGFIWTAIVVDDLEVGKAISNGIFLSLRHFSFVVPMAILFTLVSIGVTYIFVYIFNALAESNKIIIPVANFYNSYLQVKGLTSVRVFTILTSTFLTPLQIIAFTLAYLKVTPRIVKPEVISPFEQGSTIESV